MARITCDQGYDRTIYIYIILYITTSQCSLLACPGRIEEAIIRAICPSGAPCGRMCTKGDGMFEASFQRGSETITRTFDTPSKCHGFLLGMSAELHTGNSGKAALATGLLLTYIINIYIYV